MDNLSKEKYMKRAISLAKKAAGYTNPNPMVGCVVVKDGRIISEGYHERYGEFHAERNALLNCKEDATGAELFVTLEPCCHHGKTPPCTEIIIEKKISKVYVGSMDSNPLVGGKGIKQLIDAGIEVETGILEEECLKMNEVFFHYIETSLPFVAMKYAMTLDGKIACETGDSKWVTNEKSRAQVQNLRKLYKGIMVGIGTVLADDPMLNCRLYENADPVRIICDSRLRIPLDSQLVKSAHEIPTIVACNGFWAEKNPQIVSKLEEAGIEIIATPYKSENMCSDNLDSAGTGVANSVDLNYLMIELGKRKIDSILLEGGATLNASALEAGIVNKVYAFIAPKLVGGKNASSPVSGEGISLMANAVNLENIEIEHFDNDICIIGYPQNNIDNKGGE